MKIRLGFVSNSSASSFTLDKKTLTPIQIAQIHDHINVALANEWHDLDYVEENNAWVIQNTGDSLHIATCMTNFNMIGFLQKIGVPKETISNFWHSNGSEEYDEEH